MDKAGDMLPEVRARAAEAGAALRELRGPVLRSPGVHPRARESLTTALVASKLEYNARAWTPLGAQAAAAFEMAFMRAAREVSGLHGHLEGMATDAAILAAIPSNSPSEVLSAARLRFLPRLVRHAPPVLLALLATGDPANRGHWKGALAADLAWMADHAGLQFREQSTIYIHELVAYFQLVHGSVAQLL